MFIPGITAGFSEPDIDDFRQTAIRFYIMALLAELITIFIGDFTIAPVQLNSRNTRLFQAEKLTFISHAVAITILPDLQAGKNLVFAVNHPVAVAVIIRQRQETISRGITGRSHGVIAKQLTAIINHMIAVTVQHQQTIVFSCPARKLCVTIAVVVEVNRIFCGFHTVTVKIDNQRAGLVGSIVSRRRCLFSSIIGGVSGWVL